MSIFKKLLGGGVSTLVDSVSGVVDKFTLSKEEKQQFKLEMQSRLMQMEQQLQESYQKELDTRAEVIKAELAQGDLYTKRARPTIVYAGLLFIFIVYVLVPIFTGDKLDIQLPQEFWWAWGTVVGVYGVGRSFENAGAASKVTSMITGSKAYKAGEEVKG